MKTTTALLLLLLSQPCLAQKWIDDKGKVYYGDPPPGVNVREAPMTGGTTSSVGAQQPSAGAARAERGFQDRAARRTQAEDSARRQKEANQRLKESAEQAKKKQQEDMARREAQEAARYRAQHPGMPR